MTAPKGGRHANPIILSADQQEYLRGLKSQERNTKKFLASADVFDVEYSPAMLSSHATEQRGWGLEAPMVGHGRKNVNESRKRVNKKKKHSGGL